MSRYLLVIIVFVFSSSFLTANEGEEEWSSYLNMISIHYISSIEVLILRDYENAEDAKDIREFVVTTMPFWFNVFIAHDKFEDLEDGFSKSYVVQIKKIMKILSEDEIKSAFSVYLDPRLARATTFRWSVKGYTLSEFKKDFPDFLKLRD